MREVLIPTQNSLMRIVRLACRGLNIPMVKDADHPGHISFQAGKIATGVAVSVHHIGGDDVSAQLRDVGNIGVLNAVVVPVIHFV